ncbi:hypothetical protein ACWEQC_11145 [Streptomyces shenzhenensis]
MSTLFGRPDHENVPGPLAAPPLPAVPGFTSGTGVGFIAPAPSPDAPLAPAPDFPPAAATAMPAKV